MHAKLFGHADQAPRHFKMMKTFPDISSERLRVCRNRSPALEGSEFAARVCLLSWVFKRFDGCKVPSSAFPFGTLY